MAITVVGTGQGGGINVTTHSFTLPTGIQNGDKAVVVFTVWTARTFTAPAAWTALTTATPNATNKTYVYTANVNAVDSGTTVTFTASGTTYSAMAVIVLRGAQSFNTFASASGTTLSATIPAITPTVADALHLALHGVTVSSGAVGTVAEATGWTERLSYVNNTSLRAEIQTNQFTGGANTVAPSTTEAISGTTAYWATIRLAVEPTGVTSIAGGYTAQPMFATADAPGGTAVGNIRNNVVVTDDAYINSASTSANTGASTAINMGGTLTQFFNRPALAAGEGIASATLMVRTGVTPWPAGIMSVYKVNGAWSESTITYANAPSLTLVKTINFPSTTTADTWVSMNVTEALGNDSYGVALKFNNSGNVTGYSTENTTSTSYAPFYNYSVSALVDTSYSAQATTASALMRDPVVDATHTVSASGQPFAANAAMPDAVGAGSVLIDLQVTAGRMDAYADIVAGAFSIPITVAANPMIATGSAVQPQAGTTQGVVVGTESMDATARWVRPTVNGNSISVSEDEDRYFARVMGDSPRVWMRLADKGSTAADRVGLVNTAGTYHGALTGQYEAPEGRHSVYFNGTASLEQTPPGDNLTVSGVLLSTLEFSFRTNKANEFILAGVDGPGTFSNPAKEVYLRDGRIAYRTHYDPNSLGIQQAPTEFRGFKNLADGQWHHVVIKGGTYRYLERGVEIWVDGKLEVRRVNANAMWGFPDWIGSRPAELRGRNIGALPGSLNFVGDMSEVVFYGHDDVNDDDIPRHYYAFMGWNPIEATPMEALGFTPAGTNGKGNQKRALYLWWSREQDMYNVGGDGHNNKMSFDPIPWAPRSYDGTVDYAGYKVFIRSIAAGPEGATYRDEVTDAAGLIDLSRDVDMNNYDVVMFADWPDEGAEFDALRSGYPQFDAHYQRLVRQLSDLAADGKGLFVTVPRLAIELGVVDRIENVPTLLEQRFSTAQGAALGFYDYGSAYKFPWNIRGSAGMEGNALVLGSPFNGQAVNRDPSFLAAKAFYYEDANRNNRFRVRALIDGLTDIPSYMVTDQVHQKDYDVYGWEGIAYKYLHRTEGLRIGDEYIFHGAEFFDNPAADYTDIRLGRYYGYVATPLANVKAGVVVTTFGAKHWNSDDEVDNPYRNYATTIVVRPGDTLNGRSINGKVYVNFTEAPSRQREHVLRQVLPENGVWPARYNPDTAEQKEWEYSWTRHTLTNTSSQSTPVSYVDPLGNTVTIQTGGSDLSMVRSNEIFPVEAFPSYNMNMRGLFWLREGVEQSDGSTTAVAAPMAAEVATPNPTVTAQRDGGYRAQPMNALAVATKVAEDKTGAVEINTLPMTAAVTWTGFGRTIKAGPMTAEAEFVENFDAVHTTGEQVVLTLHGVDVTLFIKEEA